MHRDRIYISFVQGNIHQLPFFHAVNIFHLWNPCIFMTQENAFRLAGRLNGNRLPFQVWQLINIAVFINCNNLITDHVRSRPLIFRRSSLHGKASPDTVNFAFFQQCLFHFPIYVPENRFVSHSAKCFYSKFHINSGGIAIFVQIIVRGITVTADNNLLQMFFSMFWLHLFMVSSTSTEQCRHETDCCHSCHRLFQIHVVTSP